MELCLSPGAWLGFALRWRSSSARVCVRVRAGVRPVRGGRTAKTVQQPQQQPAHPQYANYWAPLTRKWHIMPHSAQPQHTNYWAPRTRKRHQQEHRPQRLTDSSDPTQHAKGRTGACPGPRKGTTTRRNVTTGAGYPGRPSGDPKPKPKQQPLPLLCPLQITFVEYLVEHLQKKDPTLLDFPQGLSLLARARGSSMQDVHGWLQDIKREMKTLETQLRVASAAASPDPDDAFVEVMQPFQGTAARLSEQAEARADETNQVRDAAQGPALPGAPLPPVPEPKEEVSTLLRHRRCGLSVVHTFLDPRHRPPPLLLP